MLQTEVYLTIVKLLQYRLLKMLAVSKHSSLFLKSIKVAKSFVPDDLGIEGGTDEDVDDSHVGLGVVEQEVEHHLVARAMANVIRLFTTAIYECS